MAKVPFSQQACTALASSRPVQEAIESICRVQPDIARLPCGRHLGAGVTSLLTDTERLTTLIAGLSVLALGVYSAREGTRVGGRAFDRSAPQPSQTPCAAERCKCLQNSVSRMAEYAAPLPDKCEGSAARPVPNSIHMCHHLDTKRTLPVAQGGGECCAGKA